ncbi:MAG: choice-of-anchor J domain-containing protein [Sphingobacteriaceae bacterium]|nr:choice-of-anchor J domain-containing protein [Sphingobacteriaceae bacterium]
MRTKQIIFSFCALLIFTFLFQSCKKKEKDPVPEPVTFTPTPDKKIVIFDIKNKYGLNPNQNYKFTDDSLLYCTVIADEVSGNFFKELFVKDGAGAIRIKLTSNTNLIIGDSIKINLKGAYLNDEFDLIQLDSVNPATMITKIASGKFVQPEVMTIVDLISNSNPVYNSQSRLVRIENVEFVNLSFPTFADPVLFTAKNHSIQACGSFPKLAVRTSGYANFAGTTPPTGNGSMIAIVSQFGSEVQLRIRKLSEVSMTGTLCNTVYLSKNFEDLSLTSGGWTQQAVSGSVPWKTGTFNSLNFASCNNYSAGVNSACESWLISPAINLSASSSPNLYFQNACKFNGPAVEVYVSTNYNTGLPNTASWTQVFPTLSTGNFVYVNSGSISLSAYKTTNTRIGFKYIGSNVDGREWQIDDITVKEN